MSKRIDVKNLDIYYSDFLAVKDVSVTIEPRSVTALIGPSGCGKTTLGNALAMITAITVATVSSTSGSS